MMIFWFLICPPILKLKFSNTFTIIGFNAEPTMKLISGNKCKSGMQHLKRKVLGNLFFLETSINVTNLNKIIISTESSPCITRVKAPFHLTSWCQHGCTLLLNSVLINLLNLLVNPSTWREATRDLFHTEFYGLNIGPRHLKCPGSIHFSFL